MIRLSFESFNLNSGLPLRRFPITYRVGSFSVKLDPAKDFSEIEIPLMNRFMDCLFEFRQHVDGNMYYASQRGRKYPSGNSKIIVETVGGNPVLLCLNFANIDDPNRELGPSQLSHTRIKELAASLMQIAPNYVAADETVGAAEAFRPAYIQRAPAVVVRLGRP